MKHIIIFILIVAIILLQSGCSGSESLEKSSPIETGSEKTSICRNSVTEEDLLNIFQGYAYADPSNRVVLDCVVLPESAYGILGVVQYTTEDYAGCWFDFIGSGQPKSTGVEAVPFEHADLQADGPDAVSCKMRTLSGDTAVFTIAYYETEIGFAIESE